MKWKMVEPSFLRVNREVPSGITPLPCVARILGHRFVFDDWQKMHDSSLPATVNSTQSPAHRELVARSKHH